MNYAKALEDLKRGFLIVGLTGYTGSGCSTARGILTGERQPVMPAPYSPTLARNEGSLGERRYRKLGRIWQEMLPDLPPFIPIKLAVVIFALAVAEAQHPTTKEGNREWDEDIDKFMRNHCRDYMDLNGLQSLQERATESKDFDFDLVIRSYELCCTLYEDFCKLYKSYDLITKMQDFGNKLRSVHGQDIIPEATSMVIKSYRESKHGKFFCIDAFRSPYAVEYFKRRYSEFYLVCIMRGAEERRKGLEEFLLPGNIEELENTEKGHGRRRRDYKETEEAYRWFIYQNVEECAQRADFFVKNVEDTGTIKTYPHLTYQLIRLLCLTQKPGCVPPTADERAMQIAMTTRHMSGCISRQVGAVVTGPSGYIIGVGWNDPPEGQTPCSLRTGNELLYEPADDGAFSDFERSDKFRKSQKLIDFVRSHPHKPFCFANLAKSFDQKVKGGDSPRALHAEENAFLQVVKNGGVSVVGSTLYTTASPCVLCAKKAYQLGISRIVYVDEYADIAMSHVLKTGQNRHQIKVEMFEGVTGSAYFRLFSRLCRKKILMNWGCKFPLRRHPRSRRLLDVIASEP